LNSVKISVLGLEEEKCKLFIKESCSMPVPAGSGFRQIDDTEIQLTCRSHTDMEAALKDADCAVVLVHHLDLISVESLRKIHEHLASKADIPCFWALLRLKDENQFKISCIECGQKMWIPDDRKGAKARCPKCKKSFSVFSREEYLQLVLGIDDPSRTIAVDESKPETFERIINQLVNKQPTTESSKGSKTKIRIRKKTED